MVAVEIRGVDVRFPYKPYECQIAFMGEVIQALEMVCHVAIVLTETFNYCYFSIQSSIKHD